LTDLVGIFQSKKTFEKTSADAEQIRKQVHAATGSGQTRGAPSDMSRVSGQMINDNDNNNNVTSAVPKLFETEPRDAPVQ